MVKLNDGTKVPLQEFITWHHIKQHIRTIPLEEHKRIIAARVEKSKRAVITPLGTFKSLIEAAKKNNITIEQLRPLIRNTAFPKFKFVNPRPRDAEKEFYKPKNLSIEKIDKVVTPLGNFPTKRAAEKVHGFSKTSLNTLLVKDSEHYYFIENGPKPNPVPSPKPPKTKKPKKPQISKHIRLSPEAYKAAITKRAKEKLRAVITPFGNFESCDTVAEFLGVRRNFVLRLIHNTAYPEYTYVNPIHISKSKIHHKVKTRFLTLTVTPFGTFSSKSKIHKEIGISYEEVLYLMEKHPKDFYFIQENEKLQHLNRDT